MATERAELLAAQREQEAQIALLQAQMCVLRASMVNLACAFEALRAIVLANVEMLPGERTQDSAGRVKH